MLVCLLLLLLLLPARAEPEPSFDSDWGGRQEAEQAILKALPSELGQAARGYLEQAHQVTPDIHRESLLQKFRQARREWARVGPQAIAQLTPFLGSDQPWERYEAALLLGGTHSAAAIPPLRARLEEEKHRDVGYALNAALAELGDETTRRIQALVAAERAERDRGRAMPRTLDARARRSPEIRCCHLIELVCGVHRPEVVALDHLAGDDGALGETHGACRFYLLNDLAGSEPRVVTKGFRRTEQNGLARVLYRYPAVRGLADPKLQSRINRELRAAFVPARLPQLSPRDGIYETERTFRVGRLDERYLSVRYTGWGRHRGSSSTTRFFAARTIDLRTGRTFELRDLFLQHADYMDRLRTLAEPIMARSMGADPGPTFMRNTPGFYLTPKKLVLFDLFRDGTDQDVPIEASQLSDLADKEGPLSGR